MQHARQPSTVYDLTVLASAVARYNVQDAKGSAMDLLREEHAEAIRLVAKESANKPPVPHADKELLKASEGFATKILTLLGIAERSTEMPSSLAAETRAAVSQFADSIRTLKGSEGWMAKPEDIDGMFGIPVSQPEARQTMERELIEVSNALTAPDVPKALKEPITGKESNAVFDAMRTGLFGRSAIAPLIYTEPRPEKHYLFWTPIGENQECAVPDTYSAAEHFRFHAPHNDAHLSHLFALKEKGASAYMDYMDERAFFEAIAVHSEWQIKHALEHDENDFRSELHASLDAYRRNELTPDEFAMWMIGMRAYECRLRAARLVADVLTIHERLPFDAMLEKSMSITGLPKEDAEAEARKYYFLPGLGAVYTLGYRKLLESGITNPMDAIHTPGGVSRTWNDFRTNHGA